MQHAGADILALQLRAKLQQHRGARLQHVAVLREPFGKQHGFEMAGRIGQPHDAHLVAGLGAPFHRDTTVAATLPAVAPVFTARENSAHDCTRKRFSTVA